MSIRSRAKKEITDFRDGVRILTSAYFWRAFRDYWSGDNTAARIDDFTASLREATGQKPDPELERRRAARKTADQ